MHYDALSLALGLYGPNLVEEIETAYFTPRTFCTCFVPIDIKLGPLGDPQAMHQLIPIFINNETGASGWRKVRESIVRTNITIRNSPLALLMQRRQRWGTNS